MNPPSESRRWWRYVGALAAPVAVWVLFVVVLVFTLRERLHGDEEYDRAALREWIEESRIFRATLAELVRDYLEAADPDPDTGRPDLVPGCIEVIKEQLLSLGDPTKMYQGQLPLFPAIYRLELEFQPLHGQSLPPIVWESAVPRPRRQALTMDHNLLGPGDNRAVLHIEYQLHAYNKRQRDEQAANVRLRRVTWLAVAATFLAFAWIYLLQRRERDRQHQRQQAELQIHQAERRQEETERKLLEQRLATQAAERQALELKSQLYASIGIMAGSYAHNIKNLLVRPNDLLRRCLEGDGLTQDQDYMLREVRQTLGTVTERLQQILQTVRRDPSRSVLTRIDLNAVALEIQRTWADLAREKWKLTLTVEPYPEPLWIEADLSHLQQAVENLLFNARDATFEMRGHLREEARHGETPQSGDRRQALIAAAAWKGTVILRTRRQGDRALLEVRDNGIGMTEDVRRRCTETHFSTKRDNALHEGNSTGMGLGLSFVVVILEHQRATLDIESEPLRGALFRASFPLLDPVQ